MGRDVVMKDDIDKAALLIVLQLSRDLVARSEDSDWSCMTAEEILMSLDNVIQRLEQSRSIEIDFLRFLFVVAGPLQETSMNNDWSDEYLKLAKLFDKSIGDTS